MMKKIQNLDSIQLKTLEASQMKVTCGGTMQQFLTATQCITGGPDVWDATVMNDGIDA